VTVLFQILLGDLANDIVLDPLRRICRGHNLSLTNELAVTSMVIIFFCQFHLNFGAVDVHIVASTSACKFLLGLSWSS
jgi:hypothetical protein